LRSRAASLENNENETETLLQSQFLDQSSVQMNPKNDELQQHPSEARKACNFCKPELRCRTCEKRIQMIPSILSLLVKNDFIGVRELGVLAFVSPMLRQYICVDADDDVWLSLLHRKWPSTTKIPRHILAGLCGRLWYKRLHSAVCVGEKLDGEEFEEYVIRERHMLRTFMLSSDASGSKKGEFPVLATPSLVASGVMYLVDFRQNGKSVVSLSYKCEENDNSPPFGEAHHDISIFEEKVNCQIPLKLDEFGDFHVDTSGFRGSVHAVRLTNYKIMCLANSLGAIQIMPGNLSAEKECIEKPRVCWNLTGHHLSHENGRIRQQSIKLIISHNLIGFLHDFFFHGEMMVDLPYSPRVLGHEYTVDQFWFWYSRDENDTGKYSTAHCFDVFSKLMWRNGASKPELVKFFTQARDAGSINGEYFGKTTGLKLTRMSFRVWKGEGIRYNEW